MVGARSTRISSLTAALMLALLALAPSALACPYCAGQDKGDSIGSFLVIGAMVFFPFLVVAVVIPIVRRVGSEADDLARHGRGES